MALDPRGLIARDPKSHTGEAIRIVGYSLTAARVLIVVLLPTSIPRQGSGTSSPPGPQPDNGAEQARDQAEERWKRDLRATTDHLRRLLDERPGA